jgi:hypothetical protein
MRASSSLLHLSRYGWFVLIGVAFGAKDVCFGSKRPPPDPDPPADASDDGTMSRRELPRREPLAVQTTTPARSRRE